LNFRLYLFIKRCLDIAITLVALALLWPVMVAIAVVIVLDSPGPVIFSQERVGAKWRPVGFWEVITFRCLKFRTMTDKCDGSMHKAFVQAFVRGEMPEQAGLPYKLNDDPRITRVGRWLRKSSLDELPQLINILKGEMSWVGPRPVPIYEVAAYRQWHRERLEALPGLTGLWQVKGRSQVTFDEMARLDIEYVRHPSVWLDLKLLVATVPAVLSSEGAN